MVDKKNSKRWELFFKYIPILCSVNTLNMFKCVHTHKVHYSTTTNNQLLHYGNGKQWDASCQTSGVSALVAHGSKHDRRQQQVVCAFKKKLECR